MLYLSSFFIYVVLNVVHCQDCRSGELRVIPDKTNKKLNGTVITVFSHYGPNLCFDECIRRPRCHSFNYNKQMYFCELNSEPLNLVYLTAQGFDFVDISFHRGVSKSFAYNIE